MNAGDAVLGGNTGISGSGALLGFVGAWPGARVSYVHAPRVSVLDKVLVGVSEPGEEVAVDGASAPDGLACG